MIQLWSINPLDFLSPSYMNKNSNTRCDDEEEEEEKFFSEEIRIDYYSVVYQ